MSDDDISDLEKELEGASEPPKPRRLTPAEWEQIKKLWEFGTVTLGDLEARFGIRKDTIQKRLKEEGIVKGSRAHEIGEAAEAEIVDTAVQTTRRIQETKEAHYRYAEALSKIVMQEVVNTRKAGRPLVSIDGNLAALNKAARTLEVLRRERYKLLGLDQEDASPDEMPEMLVSEMTGDMIAEMQRKMREGVAGATEFNDLDDIAEESDDDSVIETEN